MIYVMNQDFDHISDMKNLAALTTYQAGAIQASANRSLQKFSDQVLEKFGITKMQWLIIGSVYDAGSEGVRVSDLAKQLGTNIPYLTNTINLLESKSILERSNNSKDNRAKSVTVAPRFASICPDIEATLRQALRQSIYGVIDPQDFLTYIKVMYRLSGLTGTD